MISGTDQQLVGETIFVWHSRRRKGNRILHRYLDTPPSIICAHINGVGCVKQFREMQHLIVFEDAVSPVKIDLIKFRWEYVPSRLLSARPENPSDGSASRECADCRRADQKYVRRVIWFRVRVRVRAPSKLVCRVHAVWRVRFRCAWSYSPMRCYVCSTQVNRGQTTLRSVQHETLAGNKQGKLACHTQCL